MRSAVVGLVLMASGCVPAYPSACPYERREADGGVSRECSGEYVAQEVLPIFRAQADVGNAVVTVTVEQKKPEAA